MALNSQHMYSDGHAVNKQLFH